MTARGIPLGRKETQRLEFKSRDSLNDRHSIGREVVGMLNSEQGGEIWVGLGEEDHRAARVEGISDTEVEARSLHDFLMDSLEPAPLSGEIAVEVERSDEEEVLRIQVEGRRERRPYALLRRGARTYVVRVGDRLRPMTREEILGDRVERQGGREEDELHVAIQQVRHKQERLRKLGKRIIWLWLRPVPGGDLALQHSDLGELLIDPTKTGNQRARRTFADAAVYGAHGPSLVKRGGRGALELGAEGCFTRIYRDGGLEVEFPLAHVFAPPSSSALRVAEFLASVVRLLQGLFTNEAVWENASGDRVVGQLALFRLKGMTLLSQAASSGPVLPGLSRGRSSRDPYPDEDFTLDRVLIVSRSEIVENPDRIAFRMLRELFEAFGYPESEMPREFDRKTGRLVLPE